MNDAHDLGGMHGFGPVEHEENEPYFHYEWERHALALVLTAIRVFNMDRFRHAIERTPSLTLWLILAGALWTGWGRARPTEHRRADGRGRVYTAAQAERGKAQYETTCQRCHRAELSDANARGRSPARPSCETGAAGGQDVTGEAGLSDYRGR